MASNDSRPPEQEPELSNPMSNRGFWIATFVMLAAVVLFLVFQNPPGARVLPYSELRQKITDNAAERVIVQETVIDAYPTKEARKALKDEKKGGFVYWRASKPTRDETLIPLLDRAKVKYEVRNGCDDSLLFFWVLPLLLFLFFFNTMMRRLNSINGPSNPAMDFAKSRAKMYVEEGVGVVFDDVAGCDEAKEELGEVVDFLKDPDKITRLGGRAPRGVLLVGPPGTGKTLLARAVAGEAGVPFFNLSGSDFVEMFVGVGAARVRDLFEQAKAHEPCIIFIDELDAIGKSRAANQIQSNDEREQTLNALLVEMDGFDARSQVIILAATNRPEILDKALLRPGRFDRQVVVDRPDVKGREEILKVHARAIVMDAEDVDLKVIAGQTPGFVGADLANVVNEAALLAARAGKDAVTLPDFQEAIERVVAGLEKKNRRLGDKEINIVAYHESGHAIVAAAVSHADPVHKVSIVSRGVAALGYTLQVPTEDRYLMTRAELEDRIAVLLGGRAAEQIIFGDISTGASNDLQRVTDIARGMVVDYGMSARIGQVSLGERGGQFIEGMGGRRDYSERTAETIDEEVREIVGALYAQTVSILERNVELLHRMADTLKAQEVLDGDELAAMLASARRPEPGEPSPEEARDGSLP